MRLARQLLSFENPVPGAPATYGWTRMAPSATSSSLMLARAGQLLSLRGLVTASQVPGSLHLPRERLRVPPFFGLPYSDVPLTPLLMRLDGERREKAVLLRCQPQVHPAPLCAQHLR